MKSVGGAVESVSVPRHLFGGKRVAWFCLTDDEELDGQIEELQPG